MVNEVAAPLATVTKGYTKEGFSRQSMNLLSQAPAIFGGLTGSLYSVSQKLPQGQISERWIGVFEEPPTTFIVTATFPNVLSDKLSGPLRQAVQSARVIEEPADSTAALTFTITPALDLKIAQTSGNNVIISRGGIFPVKELEHPILVVGSSPASDLTVPNRLAFTMARLKSTAGLTNILSYPPTEVQIDGLPGYEIVSQANHRAGGKRAILYQVILFEPSDYYLMQGIVAESDQEEYVRAFRMSAMSFRRKNVQAQERPSGIRPR